MPQPARQQVVDSEGERQEVVDEEMGAEDHQEPLE
jgi:hypothetical protein